MMASVSDFIPGGYTYIPSVFQYSAGVAASPGYKIERIRFHTPVPIAKGFELIAQYITDRGRPLTAFCACELRSPKPWDDAGFIAFNKKYVVTLAEWGIFDGTRNPVARSNLCPDVAPPTEECFHAFSITVKDADAPPSFVNAGGAEARPGTEPYRDRTIRHGETSADAMTEKARFVIAEQERRMNLLGFGWRDTTATQVYTVYDIYPFLADELVRRGAAHSGITLHYHRPPVRELDFEMDCRGVRVERVIEDFSA
jgi:hypothetical protein